MKFRFPTLVLFVFLVSAIGIAAQSPSPSPVPARPAASPTPAQLTNPKNPVAPVTPEPVVESAIFIYGLGGGRERLDQIRKTVVERGKSKVTAADGRVENATYTRYISRGTDLWKDKIRLDQEVPNARFSLLTSSDKIILIFNNTVLPPSDEAANAFQNVAYRSIEGLLRYKENGSTIALAGKEKELGVEFYMIDVTDNKKRTTRYYVSVKSFRVMMLTYEEAGVKYKRKFYNYNYAQGTLVPYRTVLMAGNKVVEETDIGTITFGQKIDEEMFNVNLDQN
ncbi:MAG TPA: hypothetical protein PKA82_06635 [Pyrinomonadaceae bacterium]|nr:hypothetical protein [Pyrinomonadaceae bacterium]